MCFTLFRKSGVRIKVLKEDIIHPTHSPSTRQDPLFESCPYDLKIFFVKQYKYTPKRSQSIIAEFFILTLCCYIVYSCKIAVVLNQHFNVVAITNKSEILLCSCSEVQRLIFHRANVFHMDACKLLTCPFNGGSRMPGTLCSLVSESK